MENFLKNKSGIIATDAILAVLIISIFAGIIATISYNIYLSSTSTKRNSQATGYMVSFFEKIDGMKYNEVNQDVANNIVSNLSYSSGYAITANVQNYVPEEQGETEDLIKTVDLKIEYKVGNKEQKMEANHIKAREFMEE